jgi:hypothetical protein
MGTEAGVDILEEFLQVYKEVHKKEEIRLLHTYSCDFGYGYLAQLYQKTHRHSEAPTIVRNRHKLDAR